MLARNVFGQVRLCSGHILEERAATALRAPELEEFCLLEQR